MSIELPLDLEQYVAAKLASGEFPDANQMVAEGLRVLREKQDKKRQALIADIQIGIDQADRGEVEMVTAAQILAEIIHAESDPSELSRPVA